MSLENYRDIPLPHKAPQKIGGPAPIEIPRHRRRRPYVPPVEPRKIEDVFKDKKRPQFDQNTGFNGGPSARRKGYRLAAWSWLASVIDSLILISIGCAFVIAFSLTMKVSAGVLLMNSIKMHSQSFPLVEILLAIGWIYLVSVRGVLGYTLGEWACDLRLGQPHERLKANYILKVALRSTFVLMTGVFILPLLSLVFGRDVAGILSGLKLFSLK